MNLENILKKRKRKLYIKKSLIKLRIKLYNIPKNIRCKKAKKMDLKAEKLSIDDVTKLILKRLGKYIEKNHLKDLNKNFNFTILLCSFIRNEYWDEGYYTFDKFIRKINTRDKSEILDVWVYQHKCDTEKIEAVIENLQQEIKKINGIEASYYVDTLGERKAFLYKGTLEMRFSR